MTINYFKKKLKDRISKGGGLCEVEISLNLLFHGLQLDDICNLRVCDVIDAHWGPRQQIRKLHFVIPSDLKIWIARYMESRITVALYTMEDRLLPNYPSPIKLAQQLEDHGFIPEEVIALGQQCYQEHLDKFRLPLRLEI